MYVSLRFDVGITPQQQAPSGYPIRLDTCFVSLAAISLYSVSLAFVQLLTSLQYELLYRVS
jgi:hypothetical protein